MQINLNFCLNKVSMTIFADCSGAWSIEGEPNPVTFDAPTSGVPLLGAPFLPDEPELGYAPEMRHLANAEHEALHFHLCERLFSCPSPNHCILARNIEDEVTCLDWRTVEERMVVAVQFRLNTGAYPVFSDAFGEVIKRYQQQFDAATEWLRVLRVQLRENLTACQTFHTQPKRFC